MRTWLVVIPLAVTFLAASPPASAQQPRQRPQQAAQGEAAQAETPRPTTPPYDAKIAEAITAAMARDYTRALAALRQAVTEAPTRPGAYYFQAEVHRLNGRLDEAAEAFRTAARMAVQSDSPLWQARALQGIAETLERQPDALEQARRAWNDYSRFADANRSVSSPELARARIQAIDQVMEQEQAYVAVRERIAERERENAQPQQQGRQRPRSGGN